MHPPQILRVTLALAALIAATSAASDCARNYFRNDGGRCQRCAYHRCEVGFYRKRCEAGATEDAQCAPCTGTKPADAIWTTFGMPYLFDNCRWRCNDGWYQDGGSCIKCETGACPGNKVRAECAAYAVADAPCVCPPGSFLDPTSDLCMQCSTAPCPAGQARAHCTGSETADAGCA